MFRLPTCPYCDTIYRYRDVRKNKKINKDELIECYHCSQNFKQSKRGYIIIFGIVAIIAVIINIIVLNISSNIFHSIIPVIIISLVAILIGFIFTPYFIKYKKVRKNKRNIDVRRITDK